jgi:hypothetical protein
MGYRNRFDHTGQNQKDSDLAENTFKKIALSKGFLVKDASKRQQLSHIDFFVEDKNKKIYTFDVKARKKISRSDSLTADDLIWVEFKNVAGADGWLYGAADYIAFERESDFLIINRKNLVTLCERIVQNKKVSSSKEALYAKYTRDGRKDEISLIKMEDICNSMKTYIWTK